MGGIVKVLALTTTGELTYCSAPPELRGKGRCNHIAHQEPGEKEVSFLERINPIIKEIEFSKEQEIEEAEVISQEEIDEYAKKIDEIAGCKVTEENYDEVMMSLTPEQINEIAKIGFESAGSFAVPINSPDAYEDARVENEIYFTDLPSYGIAGKKSAIAQMFDKIGTTISGSYGETEVIEGNYKEGLSPGDLFLANFAARDNLIQKGVATSKPGYAVEATQVVKVFREVV